jgi:hypothetical protein
LIHLLELKGKERRTPKDWFKKSCWVSQWIWLAHATSMITWQVLIANDRPSFVAWWPWLVWGSLSAAFSKHTSTNHDSTASTLKQHLAG